METFTVDKSFYYDIGASDLKELWDSDSDLVDPTWELHLIEKMAAAGRKEREIAVAKGDIENGMPFIKVIGDGGWCTRTYGHGFGASAGVACIIGAETKQLLFVGVRNKYCYVCSKHATKPTQDTLPEHTCFKNYTGPSSGMETDAIIEGFNKSEDQHGLRYKYYIGDGDSSVYPRIRKSVTYGRSVVKIECANHVVRCYTSKLHALKKNTKFDTTVRKVLSDKLPRLTSAARGAIRQAESHQNVTMLQEDLRNGPRHVFGDHEKCRTVSPPDEPSTSQFEYCKRRGKPESNYVPLMEDCDMLMEVLTHLDYVVLKADTLIYNMTNNQAERFNSMVAKMISGKRVDHAKRGGYRGRVLGAGLAHGGGPSWHLSPLRKLTGHSPGKITKREFLRRKTKGTSATRRRLAQGPTYKKKTVDPGKEYGPLAAQEDMPEEQLKQKCNDILAIQRGQVDTFEKQQDLQERSKVVRRRATTSCHKLVERLLYNTYDLSKNKSIVFGRLHEKTAIAKYEGERNKIVMPCGLFIDLDHPFLGASPDGLVDDDGIIEVKTLPSIGSKTILEAVDSKHNICLERVNNVVRLKRKHNYFYQAIEGFKVGGDSDLPEWSAAFLEDVKPQVILHDRLMTDAALGTMPIKTEHSYSLTSDGDSIPDSPISLEKKMDDMEDECYPCIPLNSATGQKRHRSESPEITVKDEPMSDTESTMDDSDCSMSPDSPPPLTYTDIKHTGIQQSLLKQPGIVLTARGSHLYGQQNRVVMPKLNIKIEPSSSGFSLPPTPPSSTSSDSEGNVSPDHNPGSPDRQGRSSGSTRIFMTSNVQAASNRQPIQTPLISSQPKGSTGMLLLTEEEKRTLLAEGYPIPTRLPLTKAEEKSLKKIRRKIKNKISAQESRRKKKEYMDALERKVEVLTSENTDYKKKIETLEGSNISLMSQLQKLQALVARGSQSTNKMVNMNQHLTRSSLNK